MLEFGRVFKQAKQLLFTVVTATNMAVEGVHQRLSTMQADLIWVHRAVVPHQVKSANSLLLPCMRKKPYWCQSSQYRACYCVPGARDNFQTKWKNIEGHMTCRWMDRRVLKHFKAFYWYKSIQIWLQVCIHRNTMSVVLSSISCIAE